MEDAQRGGGDGGCLSVERPRCKHQPSETGGVTQPYFSCVFTKLLKVASASLRLKDFFDLPAFLQMRPCVRGKRNQVRTPAGILFPTIFVKTGKVVVLPNAWISVMQGEIRSITALVQGGWRGPALASFWGWGEAGGCCFHKPGHWLLPHMLLPRHRKAFSTSSPAGGPALSKSTPAGPSALSPRQIPP